MIALNNNWKVIIFSMLLIVRSLETGLLLLGGILLFAYLLKKPEHGTLWAVFLAGFGTVSLYNIGPVHIKAYQVVLLTLTVVLAIYYLRDRMKLLLPKGYGRVLCFFVLSLVLSILNCAYPAEFIKQSALLVIYILFMFLIINTVKN